MTVKTWSNYKTAKAMLYKCGKEKGIQIKWPLSENITLVFIHWLRFSRRLKVTTIINYLAGLKHFQVLKGMEKDQIRTGKINLVLSGMTHQDEAERNNRGDKRKPVTEDILKLLKAKLAASNSYTGTDKRMIWAACSMLFHGVMRGGEILCKNEKEFDPDYTLLTENLRLNKDAEGNKSLQIEIKAPKEGRKGNAVIIDIYQTGTSICPVKAFEKWRAVASWEEGQPAFRMKDKTPVTSNKLNRILRELLVDLGKEGKCYTTHSFRIGAATILAQKGFGEDDIKAAGRWSSRAYELYVRAARTNRKSVIKKWSKA